MDKEILHYNYITLNKSSSVICQEFGLTKKIFFNLCKKFNIIKDKSLILKCTANAGRYSQQEFLNKAKEVHGEKYDYSRINYQGSNIPIEIICGKHGSFFQKPVAHLQGRGCQKCGKSQKLMQEEFLERAKDIHGGKYSYDKTKYITINTPIVIICPKHGEFIQKPLKHLDGHGCQKCAGNNKLTLEQFINKAKQTHNNFYDYSLVDYKGIDSLIEVICPKHGKFETTPYRHLHYKCPICAGGLNTEEFIKKSREVHKNKYDYSLTEFTGNHNKVKIICPQHGIFEQTALHHHYYEHGCPKCPVNISKGHQELIDFVKQFSNITINDHEIITPNELDVFVPDKNIAFEYHGLYWHSFDHQESREEKFRHYNKTNWCEKIGVRLIQIFENEWINKNLIVKSKIKSLFRSSNRIFARNCKLIKLSNKEFNDFCNINHIQGRLCSHYRYGLTKDGELFGVIGFNKHKKYDYECTRFCNKLDTTVVGGASKLLNHFINEVKPKSILSFADRRYSNGNLYYKLGFKLLGITKPNYFYVHDKKLFSRIVFQKHKLANKLEKYDKNLSEAENMFNNKFRRIWDAGHYKFMWTA